jgi:hypothetical protein
MRLMVIRYFTDMHKWLCFRHATVEAMAGAAVHTQILQLDDYGATIPYYREVCTQCETES